MKSARLATDFKVQLVAYSPRSIVDYVVTVVVNRRQKASTNRFTSSLLVGREVRTSAHQRESKTENHWKVFPWKSWMGIIVQQQPPGSGWWIFFRSSKLKLFLFLAAFPTQISVRSNSQMRLSWVLPLQFYVVAGLKIVVSSILNKLRLDVERNSRLQTIRFNE